MKMIVAARFLFLPPPLYQGHTNKQLDSLADRCITRYFELFYKIPLILYCENISSTLSLPRKYEAFTSSPYQSLDT